MGSFACLLSIFCKDIFPLFISDINLSHYFHLVYFMNHQVASALSYRLTDWIFIWFVRFYIAKNRIKRDKTSVTSNEQQAKSFTSIVEKTKSLSYLDFQTWACFCLFNLKIQKIYQKYAKHIWHQVFFVILCEVKVKTFEAFQRLERGGLIFFEKFLWVVINWNELFFLKIFKFQCPLSFLNH